MTTLPLKGIRVLDLSRILAGPICTMMLGDLGAQIIKVEHPGSGDDTRGWGPPFDAEGQSAYYLSINRNKLSIALDLKHQDDAALARLLIAESDVVIDNFLPGALVRYKLDKGAELATNARLIWCTISGFGAGSSRPGYDFVIQAESGWMAITGAAEGSPMKTGVALADVITGKDAAVAILAALIGRKGAAASDRQLEISLSHSATAALINVAQNTLVSGDGAKRWGNAHPNLVPYQLFVAADRPLVIAVGSDSQWLAATRALGLDRLAESSDLMTNAGRLSRRDEIVGDITALIATENAAVWIERLQAVGVPCGLVRSVKEALNDVTASAQTGIAPATGGEVRYPPPRFNEHASQIRTFHWSAFDHVPILSQQVV